MSGEQEEHDKRFAETAECKVPYAEGIQQGILNVYTALVHDSIEPIRKGGQPTEFFDHAASVMEWMERRFPVIKETYPDFVKRDENPSQ